MRKLRIVSDSSSDILELENVDFAYAPMKIITAEREFVDDKNLDVDEMANFFNLYKGRSQTSCPNVTDWIDAFGDAYEFLMTMYASNAGKSGGEFFTPQEVSELLARITAADGHEIRSVYDPACGSGSLLLKFSKTIGKDNPALKYYGQEINPTTYNLCRINMFLHDINYDNFDIQLGDTLKGRGSGDLHPTVQTDVAGSLKIPAGKVDYHFVGKDFRITERKVDVPFENDVVADNFPSVSPETFEIVLRKIFQLFICRIKCRTNEHNCQYDQQFAYKVVNVLRETHFCSDSSSFQRLKQPLMKSMTCCCCA